MAEISTDCEFQKIRSIDISAFLNKIAGTNSK